ncbi:MAG: hypothetical protein JSS02_34275 [Planctomycetes bacterium]|nr:hypothetical protein [Planctomycetota bacterium]
MWLVVRIVNRRERWAKWTGAAFVILPTVYVLSYAPVIRLRNGPDWAMESNGTGHPSFTDPFFETPALYYPLERLIDEEPIWECHQKWARLWRVELTCQLQRFVRQHRREIDGYRMQSVGD